jgi:hypothetical protein
VKKIFISYASQDRDLAQRLLMAMGETGVSGWMDAADISTGTAVSAAVRTAIKQSSALVVLLSPKSLHSQWINFEVGAALALNRPIIPIIIDGPGLENKLPETFQGISFLDARDKPIAQVARDVNAALQ